MEERPKRGLENPTGRARLRASGRSGPYNPRPSARSLNGFTDKTNIRLGPRPEHISSAQVSSNTQPQPAAIQDIRKHTKVHLPKQQRTWVLKRYSIRPPSTPIRLPRRRPAMHTVLTGMAIMLLVSGLLVVAAAIRTNRSVKAQVKGISQQASTDSNGSDGDVPSEVEPPGSLGSYQVAADLPRILTIDKIGVHAKVRRLGVDAQNKLNAPANIFETGWYDGSAKPGENGTVVLDGHVSGPTKHGVFYSIGTLKSGDKVKLERGDGKAFTYTVADIKVYDNDSVDMAKVLTSAKPGKPGLNFMTCSGRFNIRTNQFEKRVVVFAVQD